MDYQMLESPSTKVLAGFLTALSLSGKRVLFLADRGENSYETLSKSLRNIPKVQFAYLANVNSYDLAVHQEVVILHDAVDELKNTLGAIRGATKS